MPNNLLFECSWGDIVLFASSCEWDAGETVVAHEPANGDEHPLQARGSRLRRASLQLLFDDFPGRPSYLSLFRQFEATTKERRLFTHPVDGTYWARIGNLTPTMTADMITATCEFLPDMVVTPVSPSGAGTTAVAGESTVRQAADTARQTAADAGIGFQPSSIAKMDFRKSIKANMSLGFSASAEADVSFSSNVSASASATAQFSASASASASATANASAYAFASVYAAALAEARATAVADASAMATAEAFAFAYASAAVDADARASVSAWTQEEDVPVSRIQTDVARLSASLEDLIETGRLEEELDLYPVFLSTILLGDSIRAASVSASTETRATFLMRVQSSTALLPLMAEIYGGERAQDQAARVMLLNNIRTPGWLEPGDYQMPVRPAAGRS